MEQLSTEIQLLRTFRHKNIVKLFASWIDEDKDIVNIIIEYFTSGSLRQYMLFLSFVPLLNVHTKHLSVFLFSTKLFLVKQIWLNNLAVWGRGRERDILPHMLVR
ncbi:hypothetical protein ZEAMMB73_Zm00001d044057 [Zea mays]|uniref:non-specific serine/threonine protein kinase n=1 Tax=Zea mays TaxID=4577 RepID=A0A1D6NHJ5_MAIZE|nr:hypothetical protein ZEAMMB73_Zm00001d053790 [Zea mays]ONM25305.1 hypothetical protein ZEAMMB73_Zm00001d006862 [Zea mays]ONM39855.1 hypothetical protein ZEAMMB73_Zm00001d044057 [Zea mays]